MSRFPELAILLALVAGTAPAQAGDAAKGEKLFRQCAACHAVGAGAKHKLGPELNNIVGWVEQLGEVDTEGVQPMTSVVDVETPMRKDEVIDGGITDKVLANAPDGEGPFYGVPKVVE